MGNGTPFTAPREYTYAGLIRLSRSNSQLETREAAAISLAGEGIPASKYCYHSKEIFPKF